jgi:hypothetical protein
VHLLLPANTKRKTIFVRNDTIVDDNLGAPGPSGTGKVFDAESGDTLGLTNGANDMAQNYVEFVQDHHLMDQFAAYWRARHRGSEPDDFQKALDLLSKEIY